MTGRVYNQSRRRATGVLEEKVIRIDGGLEIPEDELTFVASRSSGPGGQHVNKSSTRITLLFDVAGSPSLSAEQRALLAARLATRINRAGVLRVVSQQYRSQEANREAAVFRFADLVRAALHRHPPRRPTRATKAAKARRLAEKKERAELKRARGRVRD